MYTAEGNWYECIQLNTGYPAAKFRASGEKKTEKLAKVEIKAALILTACLQKDFHIQFH